MATQSYTTAGTFNHTTDAGVTTIKAEVWGGGGGGGNTSGIGGITAGAGGGGGAFSVTIDVPVTGSTTYTNGIRVGAAGAIQGAGGDSWFTIDGATPGNTNEGAMAKGGGGASTTTPGQGGAAASGIGDTRFEGGDGVAAGGAGGCAGTTGNGKNGSGTTGGAATAVGGGGGGDQNNPGGVSGGGGGGAQAIIGTAGTGFRGRVDITEGFEISVSESITVSESFKAELIHYINKSEGITVTESARADIIYNVTVSDSVIVSDTSGLNFLTDEQSGFEGGTTGNWAGAQLTVTNTTAQAHSGTRSLQGARNASGGGWNFFSTPLTVVAGTRYVGSGWLRAATVPRFITPSIFWYSDTGASVFLSLNEGAFAVDSTSGWTQFVVSAIAPATAVRARLVFTGANALTGEVHYLDDALFGVYNVNLTQVFNTAVSDSATLTESHKEELVHLVNETEDVTVSESHKEELIHYISEEENVSVTDTPNITQVHLVNTSDSIEVTENKAFTLVLNASVNDSVTVSESIELIKILLVNVSDSVTITESLGFTVVNNINVNENLSSGQPPEPVPVSPDYVLLTNGKLAVLVADISPYPLYQEL